MSQARILTDKEYRKVLLHIAKKKHHARNKCMLYMSHLAGLRAIEISSLTIADTVGAGDSFLAGLLAALLRQNLDISSEQAIQQLLRHAIASASLCVQEKGCVPPTWDQAQAWTVAHPLNF